jgi:uncharacterized protein (DUF2147 family)
VPLAQEVQSLTVKANLIARRTAAMFSFWKRATRRTAGIAGMLLPAVLHLGAQSRGVLGDWKDPTGSVIRIGPCEAQVCLWIVFLSPTAPSTTDIHNPAPGERSRALCGLKIGGGFTLRDPDHAAGGTLYDPKSGKTYRGGMTAEGSKLELRGYVGIPLFGESQTWTRITEPVKACASADRER